MSYAIRNDGLGWRSVNGPEDLLQDETYSLEQPEVLPPSFKEQAAGLLPDWEQTERTSDISYADQTWSTSAQALQDIRDALLAGEVPGNKWITADKKVVDLDFSGLQGLWKAITARNSAIAQKRIELEAKIQKMTSKQLTAFIAENTK